MSKYGNRKIDADGYTFDSLAEHRRYQELKLLQAAGEISDLAVHPVYELQPKFRRDGKTERAITIVPDFCYTEDGRTVVEDVKSPATRTPAFEIKRKLFVYRFTDIRFVVE